LRRHLLRTSAFVIGFLAAFAAGYWVSAQLGTEALRVEAQEQLASLMRGRVQIGRARLVIRGGLFLEGERVGVYPSPGTPHTPDLFASRVSAELDVLALLMGRFRLRSLTLDEAVFEIERDESGAWSPYPIQALASRRQADDTADMEGRLDLLRAFESVSRVLLASPIVARRIEVRRSRIHFVDAHAPRHGQRPVEFTLEGLEGRLVHHWLSNDADLRLRARLSSGGKPGIPIQVEGRQRRGDELRLTINADRLPLQVLEDYLAPKDREAFLDGALSGEIAYDTHAKGTGTLSLRGMIEDLQAIVDLGEGHFELKRPLIGVDAIIELHPGRVRLTEAHIEARGIELDIRGTVERPLRNAARMRISMEVGGLDLDDAREFVLSLPDQNSMTLERLLERIDSGRIVRIGGTGVARIQEWGRLFDGELDRLPRGFVLRATVADIRLVAGETGQLSDLMADVEVSGDRLALRNAAARWRQEPLPTLNLSIQGVSHLFQGPESARHVGQRPDPLPGLGALLDMMRGEKHLQDASTPKREPYNLLIRIDELQHPLLRWPIRDARLAVLQTDRGLQIEIEKGLWAAAPIRGEATWISAPERTFNIDLIVSAPTPEPPPVTDGANGPDAATALPDTPVASVTATTDLPQGAWAHGRFEMDRFEGARVPMTEVHGRFELTGSRIALSQLRADLVPRGKFVAGLDIDLDETEALGVELRFQVVEGDVARIGEAVGFPPGYAMGKLHLAGRFEGRVRPQTPLLVNLTGEVRLDARDGRLFREELPLVVALAQASEGYNQYAAEDSIVFEHAKVKLRFDSGRLSADDFELEGPLRIYASGHMDVVHPPFEVNVVVGLFLFRGAGNLMETIPLVKAILPGSERGLVGAYYRVGGSFAEPVVVSLPGRSLAEDLPDVLAAPYQVLRALLGGDVGRNVENDVGGHAGARD